MRFVVRWPLTLILALVTIALSVIGSYAFQPRAQWLGPLDWLMMTITLFKMSWHWWGDGAAPWPLQVARFTGAFFTLSALGKVWMKFFGDQMTQFRLARWHGHVVVCGLGRKGRELAREFRHRGNRVVIADETPDEEEAQASRRHGILVQVGDAAKDVTLEIVGVERARYVFAVCRDDHTNLEIGMEALARFAASGRKGPQSCYVHLVDLPLRVLLQRHDLLKMRPEGFELRFFNIYENTARALLAAFPLEQSLRRPDDGIHLVIVGLTRLGEAVATQAARIGHYRNLRPIQVTIIDEQAEARGEQFLMRSPGLTDACDLQFLSARLSETRLTKMEFLDRSAGTRATVVFCLDRDETNVSLALTLAEHSAGQIPLLANVRERRGLAKLLTASEKELQRKGIHIFGAVEEVCGWDLLREEELDKIGKAFARFYQERHGGPGWEDLSEDLRSSNRAAADHIDVKLRTIQCRRVPVKEGAGPFEFTAEELQLLARMEHERWKADRRLNGWVVGPSTDKERKIHEDLVPWEELSEKVRDKDREQVRDLPAVLAQLGQAIRRE